MNPQNTKLAAEVETLACQLADVCQLWREDPDATMRPGTALNLLSTLMLMTREGARGQRQAVVDSTAQMVGVLYDAIVARNIGQRTLRHLRLTLTTSQEPGIWLAPHERHLLVAGLTAILQANVKQPAEARLGLEATAHFEALHDKLAAGLRLTAQERDWLK